MFGMLRILVFALVIIGFLSGNGMNPSCLLTPAAHTEPCEARPSETLSKHLAHASSAFPNLFLVTLLTILALGLVISSLLPRSAWLPPRYLQLSPEQPPRFA